jgi:hypothetical protein
LSLYAAPTTSREDFCEQLRRILAEQFPDDTVERVTIAADLEHALTLPADVLLEFLRPEMGVIRIGLALPQEIFSMFCRRSPL